MTKETDVSDIEQSETAGRLAVLLGYLECDPDNPALRADVVEMAIAAGQADTALRLLGDDLATMGDPDLNRVGLAHLARRDHARAGEAFGALIDRGCSEPAVFFNLAWVRAMEKDFGSALALLDEQVTAAIPQAAALHVELLHDAGDFELAAEWGERHLATHPDHQGLAAAMSVLALDVENPELAERCARIAGNHPDALSTLGTLSLGQHDIALAKDQFDRALELNQGVPRAWVGRGLTKLVTNDLVGATEDIDRGAALFEDHLGSWIASGWAYLIKGDLATARSRFDHAMSLDHSFGETFGSLAVLDVLDGRLDDARKGIATAFRLDRQNFSAAMAQSLLTSVEGDPDKGQQLFRRILETPVNDRGDTVMQALTRMGLHS